MAAARVPSRGRADVIDELNGHLTERTLALIGEGRSEADAASAAVAAFGGIDEVATDLYGARSSPEAAPSC